MIDSIHQPHDKFFKLAMGNIAVAQDFFQAHVPVSLLNAVDLSSLKLQKETFVDEHFKTLEADVVYSAQFDGELGYFYILSEQQSAVDDWISFRLLRYMLRIMAQHRKQYPDDCLPIVYPIVIYSGRPVWTAPLDIFELFGKQKELARDVFFKPYQLIDLHRRPDESFQQHLLSGIVEFALKNRQARDVEAFLKALFPRLDDLFVHFAYKAGNLVEIVLEYVVTGIDAKDASVFLAQSKKHLSKPLRGEAMTWAEALRSEGLHKGRQEGWYEATKKIARKMLSENSDARTVAKMTDLPMETVQALVDLDK
jgi:predicted transposase/invertase (TIGR01784 family)